MELKVRTLEPKDAPLAADVVKLFAGADVSLEYMEIFLSNRSNYLIVAELNGHLAGFLLAYALQRLKQVSYKMFIYEIEVLETQRRRGVGSALIAFVREIVRTERMISAFVLTSYSNEVAVEFYKSTGGKVTNGDDLMFVFEG